MLAMQAYFVGRQKLFIYVHIAVDNREKLKRIVTATLGVSLGVDGRAKEGGGGWGGEKSSLYQGGFLSFEVNPDYYPA